MANMKCSLSGLSPSLEPPCLLDWTLRGLPAQQRASCEPPFVECGVEALGEDGGAGGWGPLAFSSVPPQPSGVPHETDGSHAWALSVPGTLPTSWARVGDQHWCPGSCWNALFSPIVTALILPTWASALDWVFLNPEILCVISLRLLKIIPCREWNQSSCKMRAGRKLTSQSDSGRIESGVLGAKVLGSEVEP